MTENQSITDRIEKDSTIQTEKLTIEQCEKKITDLDRKISTLSDEIHSLESELELQRSNVDVLQIKNQENGSLHSFVIVFFLICFSMWLAFH